jgi:hypothetical protein
MNIGMDSLTLILVAFFSLVLGGLVVAVIFSLASGGRSTKKSGVQSRAQNAAGRKPASTSQATDSDFSEVARLLRDRRTGSLVVEMNGKIQPAASDLNAGEQHHLSVAARDLRSWLGLPASEPAASTANAAATPGRPASPVQPATPPPTASIPSPQPASTGRIASAGTTSPKVTPVKANPLDAFARSRSAAVSQAPAFKSITAQVDDILQRILAESPLAGRGIQLSESPEGVVVEVGVDKYLGVDAVPDEEVRQLIRQAVAEWERSVK